MALEGTSKTTVATENNLNIEVTRQELLNWIEGLNTQRLNKMI